jgi:2,3-dihydroxybenzoate decarboxylase
VIARHPGRFAGFAALPLQDPGAAAKELERAVTELGLRGALVNAHTGGRYLDDPSLRGVWERAEGLDVPLYLHPANGVDRAHVLSGHPELEGPCGAGAPTPRRTRSG